MVATPAGSEHRSADARPWRFRLSAALLSLCIAQAAHAQELVISGAELVSGQATEALASLGQRAGQQGQALRVVAPQRWHAMITRQLGAAADPAAVRFEDSDEQSISIWLDDGADQGGESAAPLAPDAPRATTPRPSDASQALRDSSRSQVENLKVEIPGADELLGRKRIQTPDLGRAPGASPEPPAEASEPSGEQVAAASTQVTEPVDAGSKVAEPEITEPEVTEPAPPPPAVPEQPVAIQDGSAAPPAEADEKSGAARASLERRVNRGKPIRESISSADLKRRDMLFVADGVIAVVRAAGTRNRVYWLSDELDLTRPELTQESASRYQVRRPLELAAPAEEAPAPELLSEKARMEARFNGGKKIERELSVAALRPEDVLYVGDGVIVVSRQVQARTRRYWLNGDLDLTRRELEKTGSRRYRVVRQLR